jgi:hypothetical protein
MDDVVSKPSDDVLADNLAEVARLTRQMRAHERQVVELGKSRRRLLRRMRDERVPFRVLAEATGTTEQAVYKDIRWGK